MLPRIREEQSSDSVAWVVSQMILRCQNAFMHVRSPKQYDGAAESLVFGVSCLFQELRWKKRERII